MVSPGIDSNDEGVAEPDTPCILGHNTGSPGGLGQSRMSRQRDAIDNEHAHAGTVLDAYFAGVFQVTHAQGYAPIEDELFLRFSPLICNRQKTFECFLVDDWHRESPVKKQEPCKGRRKKTKNFRDPIVA